MGVTARQKYPVQSAEVCCLTAQRLDVARGIQLGPRHTKEAIGMKFLGRLCMLLGVALLLSSNRIATCRLLTEEQHSTVQASSNTAPAIYIPNYGGRPGAGARLAPATGASAGMTTGGGGTEASPKTPSSPCECDKQCMLIWKRHGTCQGACRCL